jgi:dUTP pyrophosphatase
MQVKVLKLNPKIKFERAYALDTGVDLYASIDERILLKPGTKVRVPTGIKLELPRTPITIGSSKFYIDAQVRSKSGLADKHRLFVLNSPGTIDIDYKGEIQVILYNGTVYNPEFFLHEQSYFIEPYTKIAQLVFNLMVIPNIEFIENESDLTVTERADGGFGSTGV